MKKKWILFAHKPQKSWFDKKKISLQKNRICLKKMCEEKSLLRKKGFVMQKNRIYLRKKGDDKNRKKKDFFPPRKAYPPKDRRPAGGKLFLPTG